MEEYANLYAVYTEQTELWLYLNVLWKQISHNCIRWLKAIVLRLNKIYEVQLNIIAFN